MRSSTLTYKGQLRSGFIFCKPISALFYRADGIRRRGRGAASRYTPLQVHALAHSHAHRVDRPPQRAAIRRV